MKKAIYTVFVTITFVISAFAQQKEVSVYPQPDSPLLLSNVVSKWRISTDDKGEKWNMLVVEFSSQNVSDKSIRAYTIRQFNGEFSNNNGMTSFSYPATATFFKPYQIRSEDIGESGLQKIPENIKIAVDFVEFADGSTWGQDISKSAQRLEGLRAGAEASLEYLKNTNKQNGIEAVIKSLDEIKVAPTETQNDIWKSGFKTGINIIKIRIKRVYETHGNNGVEIELQKPFDTFSESR